MQDYFFSPLAEEDIESILNWTQDQFGEQTRRQYRALLTQAILDVASDPDLPGSHRRREITRSARTYHLRNSRNHVDRGIGRIRNPRHFLLYRLLADGTVEIGRVLHEAVDLPRHLPVDYRARRRRLDQ